MDTLLYKTVMKILYSTGKSKRVFAEQYEIPRAWFIDFTNPNTAFRPIQPKTIGILYSKLGIDPSICEEYNEWVYEERSKNVES